MEKKKSDAGTTKELLLRNRIHVNLSSLDISVDSHDASLKEVFYYVDLITKNISKVKMGLDGTTPKEFKEKIREVGIH